MDSFLICRMGKQSLTYFPTVPLSRFPHHQLVPAPLRGPGQAIGLRLNWAKLHARPATIRPRRASTQEPADVGQLMALAGRRICRRCGCAPMSFDEPWMQARPEEARRLALPAIDRALAGIPGPTALHLCFGH